jgi:antitoxin (DNA-binding transcriptional repressor) of toxin-antitoxin stability system
MQDTISLTEFRLKLNPLCRSVRQGKRELVIKRYYDNLFKVVKADSKDDPDFGVTYVRDNTPEFLEALETHGSVTLSSHGRVLAKCVMLLDDAIAEVKHES